MKNVAAVLFCIGLCVTIAFLYPQVGTSNPMVDATGCLASGCHVVADLHALHTDCAACHETATGGGPVDSAACLACHPEIGSELCDLAIAHPEAGCLATGCHADCEMTEGCVVTIACEETTLCTDDDCITCTATTECDGMEADGEYTWSLNMEAATGDNGSIEICPDDLDIGSNTLMVVDTVNDNAEDTETLTLEECGPTACIIDVLADSIPKSHWFALYPVLIRIETIGIGDLNLLTPVTIECESDGMGLFNANAVLKTGKIVVPPLGTNTTMIWQTALIWPAAITQTLEWESETCTVTVEGCGVTDTFELEYASFLGIPLSE